MSYLLDTNVCIALMRRNDSKVAKLYREAVIAGDSMAISMIVLFELEYGIAKSVNIGANQIRLQTLLELDFQILPLSREDVTAAGTIRAKLERTKQPIGPYDTLLAGQAVARKMTLVTANVREFSRVEGLKWVDWSV